MFERWNKLAGVQLGKSEDQPLILALLIVLVALPFGIFSKSAPRED